MGGSAGVTEGQEKTDTRCRTAVRAGPHGELRAAAAGLLRDIAEGQPIELQRVQGLARAVLDSDLVRAAQRALEADERFALRHAVELAGLLLEQASPALTSAVGNTAGDETKEE